MAESVIKKEFFPLSLGVITAATINEAMMKAFDAIPIEGSTVIGHYGYNGAWTFLARKYSSGQYGSMIAMPYYDNNIKIMSVTNGTKTIKNLTNSDTVYETLCDTNDLTVRACRCVNVVTLYIQTRTVGFASKSTWTTLINLPQKYRPIYDVNTFILDNAVSTSDKAVVALRVVQNGNVNVWPYNDTSLPVGAVTYCVN